MAFGVKRNELNAWKQTVKRGEIAFLTHYWLDDRFPNCTTVTKVGCSDLKKLIRWGKLHQLDERWIDHNPDYPHFDLFGERQRSILMLEQQWEQLKRFNLL